MKIYYKQECNPLTKKWHWVAFYNNVLLARYPSKEKAKKLAPKKLQKMLGGQCSKSIQEKLNFKK